MSNTTEVNIYQRIQAVMGAIDYVQKSDKKVNNQYTFVTHDAVSKALHPLLFEHGIVVVPRVTGWGQDGNRTSVDMEVDFVNTDNPEDRVTVPCFGFGIDPQDKGPGKAVSYATKYAMLKLFVLETGDDPERDSIDHVGEEVEKMVQSAKDAVEKGDWVTLCELDRQGELWLSAWNKLDTRKKGAIKALMIKRDEYRDRLNDAAQTADPVALMEVWDEMTEGEKAEVWRTVAPETQDTIKAERSSQ